MKHICEFPRKVMVIDDLWISMGDGCRLSARLWLPEDAKEDPVPLILEHLPYRKRDGTIERDEFNHPWMAGHGYAVLRTDMRGNGESDGLMEDEYTWREWRDACEVMAWAEEQEWCTGKCGMMGISWGGFNSLQVAALQPPQLKAVVTVCSTVDRYADDIHYKGGCHLTDNFGWSANMLSYSSRPPDPEIVGEDKWLEMWRHRLENMPFDLDKWLSHQHRDEYWKHGSICEDYSEVKAAVLSMGGWHDGYRNTISHLVENLDAPVKGIVGPWNHKYANYGGPGPTIGFLQEAKRWWDKWLKDIDNGAENDPDYRAYLMNSIEPKRSYTERPGRWIAEDQWPSTNILQQIFYLDDENKLSAEKNTISPVEVDSPCHCGAMAGVFFPFAFSDELPDEQSADDELSACFDSVEFHQAVDIVGASKITLKLMPVSNTGQVCVRLCDLFPDGQSAHITTGLFNLNHWKSHEAPEKLKPGKAIEVSFALDQISYSLPKGHRLRVAISSAHWPFVWPSIDGKGFEIVGGELSLPVRQGLGKEQQEGARGEDEWQFEASVGSPLWDAKTLRPSSYERQFFHDEDSNEFCTSITSDFGERQDNHHGLISGGRMEAKWYIQADDPCSARGETWWQKSGGRPGAMWETVVIAKIRCDEAYYHYTADLKCFLNGELFYENHYENRVERKFV